jgi:hypothetical protein
MQYRISIICDQNFKDQVLPNPSTKPKTHFAQRRIDSTYAASSNSFSTKSNQVIIFESPMLKQSFINKGNLDPNTIKAFAKFHSCGSYKPVGIVSLEQFNNTIMINGLLKIDDPYMEGHLHAYGDYARCVESVGQRVNLHDFTTEKSKKSPKKLIVEEYDNSFLFRGENNDKTSGSDLTVSKQINLVDGESIFDYIGRAIVIERKGEDELIFLSNIAINQSASCNSVKIPHNNYISLANKPRRLYWNKSSQLHRILCNPNDLRR